MRRFIGFWVMLMVCFGIHPIHAQAPTFRGDKVYKTDGQILVGKVLKITVQEVLIQVEHERTSLTIPSSEIDRVRLKNGTEIQFPIDEDYVDIEGTPYQRKKVKSTHVENSAGLFVSGFRYEPSLKSFNAFIDYTNNEFTNIFPAQVTGVTIEDPLELKHLEGNYGIHAGFRYYTDPGWSIALSYGYMSTDSKDEFSYWIQNTLYEYKFRYILNATIVGLTFRSNLIKSGWVSPILGGGFDIYSIRRKLELATPDPEDTITQVAKQEFLYFEDDARGVGITGLGGLELNITRNWAVNAEAKYTFYGKATTNYSKTYDVEMDGWAASATVLFYFK
ncbi:MAG: hypothetical protein D6675_14935 [Gemmatimonadetes bacterium]|nr:MAG: hypothetical protein D6675_14935 [Gemmatimonadota bacterium]